METNSQTSQQVLAEEATVATGLTDSENQETQKQSNPKKQADPERQRLAVLEAKKREFTEAVLAARTPEAAPVKLSPVAPRILAQTAAEMEAGKRMNAHHESMKAQRPQPKPTKTEGTMTPVFRPSDYVPDQRKGQGGNGTGARTL